VRCPIGKKRIVRSTKSEGKQGAIEFAKSFYDDLILLQRKKLPLSSSPTFERCAEEVIKEESNRAAAGECSKEFSTFFEYSVRARILPCFAGISVSDVTFQLIGNFVQNLRDANLASSTIKKYLVFVRKILIYACQHRLLGSLPPFPKVKVKDKARPWLNEQEYAALLKGANDVVGDFVRGTKITQELRYFITFMVNSFLRPSDWYKLKHRHVEVSKEGDLEILKLSLPETKAANNTVVTMPVAVNIYKNLTAMQRAAGYGNPDDYVFLPGFANRTYAKDTMRRQLDHLLHKTNLKQSPAGDARSIYSLRHTAICFRIIKGDNVNLLLLARNCLTSVQMLDRFYCQPLASESNIPGLISFRAGQAKSKDG
jgi:integrase